MRLEHCRKSRGASWFAVLGVAIFLPVDATAQTLPTVAPPIAPSQVTPRSLRPSTVVPIAPLDLAEAIPSEVPNGSEQINVRVATIAVDGDFPEMAATSRHILTPLEGRTVSVAELYRGAAALEKAYSDAGYFLARVVIAKQRLSDGETFHIRVVDGFIESIDTKGVPARVARPVAGMIRPVVGRRHLLLREMEQRLNAASAIPGISLRSTLARGDEPGAAKLILDGRHQIAGLSVGGDNRLGRSFNNWGINLQAQLNSPLGYGEQLYLFLSGEPRLNRAFRKSAPRRIAGVGALVPLTGRGLVLNPEFTVSDTHPVPANPILATDGRLYRAAISLDYPLLQTADGTLTGRATVELVAETQRLPFFNVTLSKDRLSVARGNLAWRSGLWRNARVSLDGALAHGTRLFGARTPARIARSDAPSSRGSDPQFTVANGRLVIEQAIGAASSATLIARAQTAFGDVLPSSELFDLAGLDSLSPFTAGALSADGGTTLRGEVAHRLSARLGSATVQVAPYLFAATGRPHFTIADPFSPTRASAYGGGARFSASPLLLGATPNLTLEYGRRHANRGVESDDRLSVLFGVSF